MKVYLVVRNDLSPAQQAVQVAHALQELNIKHASLVRDWHEKSNTLAFLSVSDESALETLEFKAKLMDIEMASFREADLNDSLTAIAFGPSGDVLTKKLSLALKE
jgi:peptidyl-tRNA hydrolase